MILHCLLSYEQDVGNFPQHGDDDDDDDDDDEDNSENDKEGSDHLDGEKVIEHSLFVSRIVLSTYR